MSQQPPRNPYNQPANNPYLDPANRGPHQPGPYGNQPGPYGSHPGQPPVPPGSHPPSGKPGPPNQNLKPLLFLGIGALALLVFLCVLISFVMISIQNQNQAQPDLVETDLERREEIKKAFSDPITINESERKEIDQLFEQYRIAADEVDGPRFVGCYDWDRIAVQFSRDTRELNLSLSEYREVAQGTRSATIRDFAKVADSYTFDDVEIRAIQPIGNGNEILVYAKLAYREFGSKSKMRYWLIKKNGRWKIFDHEEIDTGIRMSTRLSDDIRRTGSRSFTRQQMTNWEKANENLLLVGQLIEQEDMKRADTAIKRIRTDHLLARGDKVLLLIYRAQINFEFERYQDVLRNCDTIAGFYPDSPIVPMYRASVYQFTEEYEKAIAETKKTENLMGPDTDALLIRGQCYKELGDNEKAIESFRAAVKDDEDNWDAIYELGIALEEEGKDLGEIGVCLEKAYDKRSAFQYVAQQFDETYNYLALEELLKAYRKTQKRDPVFAYYESDRLIREKKWSDATKILRPILRNHDPEQIDTFSLYANYVSAASKAESVSSMYARMDDKTNALIAIGNQFADKDKELDEVCKLYQMDFGDDVHWLFYQSQLLENRKQWSAAYDLLKNRLDEIAKDESADSYLNNFFHSAAKSGNAIDAYRRFKDKTKAFQRLNWLLQSNEDAEGLQKLVDIRRRDKNDFDVHFAQVCVFEIKKDYKNAFNQLVQIYTSNFTKEETSKSDWMLIQMGHKTGQLKRAYELSLNRKEAFRYLARLELDSNTDEIRNIVEIHTRQYGESPHSTQARLNLAVHDKDWAKAVKCLSEFKNHESYENFYPANGLTMAMKEEHPEDWAMQFVKLCNDEQRAYDHCLRKLFEDESKQLTPLVNRLKQRLGDSDSTQIWEMVSNLHVEKKPEATLAVLKQKQPSLMKGDSEWRYRELRLECLIRAGQPDSAEAIEDADWFIEELDDPVYEFAREMAAGNRESAESALQNLVDDYGFEVETIRNFRIVRYAAATEKGKVVAEKLFE